MTKFMMAVVASLFVMSVSSLSFAGMFDEAVEATDQANAMAKDAKAKADSAEQKTIEAQDASKQESTSMVDQAKEAAKKTVNEKIVNLGK
jgi:F0F1-type ATP synthase membrane subunit b/b'